MASKVGAWFNGMDAYIETPLQIGAGDFDITIDFIFHRGNSPYQYIISEGRLINLYYSPVTDRISFWMNDGEENQHALMLVDSPQEGAEYSIRLIKNGYDYRGYVNGVLVDEMSVTSFSSIDTLLFIGTSFALSDRYLRGMIKKVEVTGRLLLDFTHGHTLDLSGNGNHGTPHNIQWLGIVNRSGLYCNGNTYISLQDFPLTNYAGDIWSFKTQFSWSGDIGTPRIYSELGSTAKALDLYIDGTNAKIVAVVTDDSGNSITLTSASTIEPYEVYKVIIVRDGNNLSMYINNQLDATTSGTLGTISDITHAGVGQTATDSSNGFQGVLQEIEIVKGAYSNWTDILTIPPSNAIFRHDYRTGNAIDYAGRIQGVLYNPLWVGI